MIGHDAGCPAQARAQFEQAHRGVQAQGLDEFEDRLLAARPDEAGAPNLLHQGDARGLPIELGGFVVDFVLLFLSIEGRRFLAAKL